MSISGIGGTPNQPLSNQANNDPVPRWIQDAINKLPSPPNKNLQSDIDHLIRQLEDTKPPPPHVGNIIQDLKAAKGYANSVPPIPIKSPGESEEQYATALAQWCNNSSNINYSFCMSAACEGKYPPNSVPPE